ncbi:MAG TPA: Gfo/Idh/MocA family oxidoreductase [Solirubrobacteraceae bacterium]
MTVQWGILSTARINEKFLAGVAGSEVVEVAAVASRDRARAGRYAEQHGIERAYGSYEELLDDPELEAVYISLPNSLHLEWSERALRAGKHVLCEKPLGRRPADVARAFDVAAAHDRLLMEAFMYRHHPQIQHTAELVESGAIGTLRVIRGAFSFAVSTAPNVRLELALAGGALMDVGCYCVNASRFLAGEPELVTGQQVLGGDGVDVVFTGTMRFAGGVLSHFDAGLVLDGRDELEIVGDQGSLFLDDPWHGLDPVIEIRRGGDSERIELERPNPYRLEADNFSAAIRGRAEPLLGRRDAIGQARTIQALYDAAEREHAVVPDRG